MPVANLHRVLFALINSSALQSIKCPFRTASRSLMCRQDRSPSTRATPNPALFGAPCPAGRPRPSPYPDSLPPPELSPYRCSLLPYGRSYRQRGFLHALPVTPALPQHAFLRDLALLSPSAGLSGGRHLLEDLSPIGKVRPYCPSPMFAPSPKAPNPMPCSPTD